MESEKIREMGRMMKEATWLARVMLYIDSGGEDIGYKEHDNQGKLLGCKDVVKFEMGYLTEDGKWKTGRSGRSEKLPAQYLGLSKSKINTLRELMSGVGMTRGVYRGEWGLD